MTVLGGLGTLTAAGGTLVGLGGGAAELFPDYSVGRSWSWAANQSDFTLTNYTVTTDGGVPALALTDPFAIGTALTNASDIAAARVTVKYRALHGAGLSIQNIVVGTITRYQASNEFWHAQRTFTDGDAHLQAHEIFASGDLGVAAFSTGLDIVDETSYQWLKSDVFDDTIRAKTWFDADSEPDWPGVARLRPTFGAGGSLDSTQDNLLETGAAGVMARYGGVIVDILVEELVRSTTNVFFNSDMSLRTGGSPPAPLYWEVSSNDQAGGNGVSIVQDVGPFGDTEYVFQSQRLTEGDGPEWNYSMGRSGIADNVFYTRDRPSPAIPSFSATVRFSLWTKGTNIANSQVSNPLSAILVTYYIDGSNNLLMNNGPGGPDGSYHFMLGPGKAVDTGTWDWTFVSYDMPIYDASLIALFRPGIGLHDPTTTGKLQWSRPRMELLP